MKPEIIACASFIVDDILLDDGRTHMKLLGGSGTHALAGMRIWSDSIGYFTTVGGDFDPMHRDQLIALGVDLAGVRVVEDIRTARAWQLFDGPDRRVEVFRTDLDEFLRFEPALADLPERYQGAAAYYVNRGAVPDLPDEIAQLRSQNPSTIILWEPAPTQLESSHEDVCRALAEVDLFCPDLEEGAALTGRQDAAEVLDALLEMGARVVALRRGRNGSIVRTARGETISVPAVPVDVVDTTGGGNAYCGGLLAALSQGCGLLEAAARASVSASFAIEQFGVAMPSLEVQKRAKSRLNWVLERIVTETVPSSNR